MIQDTRGKTLYSLGVMPMLMGLGHLAPAIGAIRTATGSYQAPKALLGMVGTASALVDSYDTYKDVPFSGRPRLWIWRSWIYSLWMTVFLCTFLCGFETALQMYRFSLIGLGWGTPCIPAFSSSSGFHLFKPKVVFREGKSLVVAACMGYITAGTSMFYCCYGKDAQCAEQSLRTRTICLAILYQFFRETACDIRDIAEDKKDNMKTLPLRLGKELTLLLMASLGALLDALLTKGVWISWSGIHVSHMLLISSIARVGGTIGMYSVILRYPRNHSGAWGVMSSVGLIPVLWAQASLG